MGACTSTASTTQSATDSQKDDGALADPFNYEQQLLADTLNQYSVIVDAAEKHIGCTAIHRHPSSVKGLCSTAYPNEAHPVTTIWEALQRGVRVNATGPCFGTRPYVLNSTETDYEKDADRIPIRSDFVWVTYSEVDTEAREIGLAIRSLCSAPSAASPAASDITSSPSGIEGKNIGIWSKNRHEWGVTALAIYSQSLHTVALYDTLGVDAVQYIIQHADIEIVFVSQENVAGIIKLIPSLTKLKHLIQFDYQSQWKNIHEKIVLTTEQQEILKERQVTYIGYTELRKMGAANVQGLFPNLPNKDSIAMIMYTSGTTGNPKGAIVQHGTLLAAVESSRVILEVSPADLHLSYLPLAHIYETGVFVAFLCGGGSIGFSTGVVKRITADIQALRPTRLFGVPRVFQRIYQVVMQGIENSGAIKKSLALYAYNHQAAASRRGEDIKQNWWPNKILGGVRKRVGLDRCVLVVTGAAPCPAYIMEFLKIILQCTVIQGYGMTETCCVIAATDPADHRLGHVGAPLPCNEIKLVDVEEMGYLSTDQPHPRGEIWLRGTNTFKGYYKDPQNTAITFPHNDGWLATGDVGRWNPNGTLSIIDRRKNLFKLSQGEYIAVEFIESTYARTACISQIWIYGNSYKSMLLGVVTPAVDYWLPYAKTHAWWPSEHLAMKPTDPAFPALFTSILQQHADAVKTEMVKQLKANEAALKGFERVGDWHVDANIDIDGNVFTTQNGCMTPTYKVRRPQLLQRYKTVLQQMYDKLGEPNKPGEKWPGE